jgi:hypothetical protein
MAWYNTHIHDRSLSWLGTTHIYMIAHFHGLVQHTYTWSLTFIERSCICVLYQAMKVSNHVHVCCTKPWKWAIMYMCVVPSNESERSCICVLYQAMKVNDHVSLTFIAWYNTHIHDCSLSWHGTTHIYMIANFHGLVQHTYTWSLTFIAWYNTHIHCCSKPWKWAIIYIYVCCTKPWKWAIMYMCVVSSNESERSCICVLYQAIFHGLVQHTYTWLLTFMAWYNTHVHDRSLSLLGTTHIYMNAHFHCLVQHTYTWSFTFMAWYNTMLGVSTWFVAVMYRYARSIDLACCGHV